MTSEAHALVPVREEPRQFCTFRLEGRLFGVDILDVKEVNTETTLTPIPHAPPSALGYVNLRGQIFLVLDIRRLLGLPASRISPESRLMIFKPTVGDSVAGLVDRIGDIVQVSGDGLEPWRPPQTGTGAPAGLPLAGELIQGICKLPDELLIVLHARKFLRAVERALRE